MESKIGESQVKPVRIPEEKVYDGDIQFPLVLEADKVPSREELGAWIKAHHEHLDDLLIKHGAILFRGFGVDDAPALSHFADAFPYEEFEYVGGNAVRTLLAPRVFTTNEAPPSEPIPFHHELAQAPVYPGHLYFSCQLPAKSGGETSLVGSWVVLEELRAKHPGFVAAVEEKGLRYIRVLSEEDDPSSAIGRGWKSTYWTDSKEEVERKLAEKGYTWEWLKDGCLKTISPVLSGVRQDPRTKRKVYFNQMIAAYTGWKDSRNDPEKAIVLGDFTPVDPVAMKDTVEIMKKYQVNFPWQKGDVVLVDNILTMHARMPFEAPRKILASLAK